MRLKLLVCLYGERRGLLELVLQRLLLLFKLADRRFIQQGGEKCLLTGKAARGQRGAELSLRLLKPFTLKRLLLL